MTSRVPAGHRHSAEAVLRQHGRRAGARDRPRQQQPAGPTRRQPRQQGAGRRLDAVTFPSSCRARSSRSATATPRRATAKSTRRRSKRRCAARLQLTVRKDMKLTWPRAETATDYITMATDPGSDGRHESRDPGDGRLPRRDEGPDETSGVSAHEHRRQRRDHAARRSAEPRRARQDAQGDFHTMTPTRPSSRHTALRHSVAAAILLAAMAASAEAQDRAPVDLRKKACTPASPG